MTTSLASSVSDASLRKALEIGSADPTTNLQQDYDQVQVVGHRGALYNHLENTRESFLQCATWNCNAVELDVFVLPRDGSVVVFHGGGTDENPGDLTDYCLGANGQSILDLTLEEAQQLTFNPAFAEFGCSTDSVERGRIPSLEQVLLDLKPTAIKIKIELKGPDTVEPVLELVEKLDMVKQCSYSCFDLHRLAKVRSLRPDKDLYPTGALFNDVPSDFIQRSIDCGATEVHLRYDCCTRSRIQAIDAAGLGSMAWLRGPVGMQSDTTSKFLDIGNEDERCYQALLETGVQQVCCNRPDVLLRMLGRLSA